MSIPAGRTKVSIIGHMAEGDIFDTGFWLNGMAVTSNADANTLATSLAGLFDTLSGKTFLTGLMAVGTDITEFRVYHYTGATTATFIGSHLQSELGGGTAQLPAQTSLVFTLLTGFAGRSNRGRMYWPADGADLSGGHQLPVVLLGHVADTIGSYIRAIDAAFPGVDGVSVVSQTNSSSRKVTSIKVDSKPDIQRRRANRVVANDTQTRVI